MRHCPSQDPESGTPFRGLPFSGLGALSPHQLAGFGGSPSPKLPAGGSHPFIRSPGLGCRLWLALFPPLPRGRALRGTWDGPQERAGLRQGLWFGGLR